MNVGLLLIGIVALLIGGGCLWAFGRKRDTVFQMKLAETRKVSEIKSISGEVAAELGAGSFNEVLEVKGTLKCARPLKSALKGEPCAHFEMEVIREYEERVERVDSEGRRRMETVRRSETLSSDRQSVEFVVDDGSGEIEIRPEGADIDSVQVLDKFEPGESQHGGGAMIRYGNFSLSVGHSSGGQRRTLGYRYRERVLPLERRVYVLGECRDDDGTLAIRRPTDSEKRFIISLKSEEELIRSHEESMSWLKYGGYIGLGAGVLFLVLSLIVR